jgi:hypothetical protein
MRGPVQTLVDISGRLKYHETPKNTNLVHIGQRKLLVSELQFLTKYLQNKDDHCIVVYIGAAPCHHLSVVRRCFPHVKFLLVDPREVSMQVDGTKKTHLTEGDDGVLYLQYQRDGKESRHIRALHGHEIIETDRGPDSHLENSYEDMISAVTSSNHSVYIIEDVMSADLSRALSSIETYMWSDVRTNVMGRQPPSDLDVLWNLSMQLNWVVSSKSRMSMLKFRQPFYDDASLADVCVNAIPDEMLESFSMSRSIGIDFIGEYAKKRLMYLEGECHIQAYPKLPASTETRLHTDGKRICVYDTDEYEEKMFYYNMLIRPSIHANPFSDRKTGADMCSDCSIEAHAVLAYESKYKTRIRYMWSSMVSRCTSHRSLLSSEHGRTFEGVLDMEIH